MSLLVLTASDVDLVTPHFTPTELMSLMARVFHLISQPPGMATYTPHRTSIPMAHHTALFMPARIAHPSLPGTTIKVVCVPRTPGDTRGLPASTLVLDDATGAVHAIVNARSLTALRNAAGSLLSTTLAGIHSPTSIVAFGAGQQILSHLDLHLRFFPSIKSCTIVNRTLNTRVDALRSALEPRFPAVEFHFLQSTGGQTDTANPIRTALLAASLIICATSSTVPLFPSHWVSAGTHVILIGSYTPAMHEVDRALVRRAVNPRPQLGRQILMVDSRTACALEAGELLDAEVSEEEVTEIGELVSVAQTGEVEFGSAVCAGDENSVAHAGERGDEEGQGPITMFKSVGVGLQDVAIACAVVDRAREMGVGTVVPGYD